MAYFANGSEGAVFDEECSSCPFGMKPCPIAGVQMTYNYDAVNNKVATNILNELVKNSGKCAMRTLLKEKYRLPPAKDFKGQNEGCGYCRHEEEAKEKHVCEHGRVMEYLLCGEVKR